MLYIIKVNTVLKYIFHISVLILIVISLYPGSIIGYLFFGSWDQQPNIIKNPFGTAINHFFYYICVSLLGFFLYLREKNFKKLVLGMFLLSIILEILHFIIPNRAFQISDIIGNILGVTVSYYIIKIYLFLKKQ